MFHVQHFSWRKFSLTEEILQILSRFWESEQILPCLSFFIFGLLQTQCRNLGAFTMHFIGIQLKMYIISFGILKEVLPLNSGFIHRMIVLWKLGLNLFFFFFPCKKNNCSSSNQACNNFIFLLFQLSRVQSKAGSFLLCVTAMEFSLQFTREETFHSKESFNLSLLIKQCVSCMVYSQLWASQLFDSPVKADPISFTIQIRTLFLCSRIIMLISLLRAYTVKHWRKRKLNKNLFRNHFFKTPPKKHHTVGEVKIRMWKFYLHLQKRCWVTVRYLYTDTMDVLQCEDWYWDAKYVKPQLWPQCHKDNCTVDALK